MSQYIAHRYDRVEDDNEFAVKLPPTLVGTAEGDHLRSNDPQEFYNKLYQEQIQQVQDAPFDPLPGSETIPGQRAAAVAAHASCSPNREHRESKPKWRAVHDRAMTADSSPPRAGQDRALVLGKPCIHHSHDDNGSLAFRAEASMGAQLALPTGVNDPQKRKVSHSKHAGISQAQLKAEALAMIELLNEFNTNGRPISQETRNVLKELAAASMDILD